MEDQDPTESLALGPRRPEDEDGSSTSGLLHLSITKSGEQSENVYENKGQGKKVEELRSREVEEWKTQTRPRVSSPGRSPEGSG